MQPVIERLKTKTTVDSITGCWIWNGSRDYQGYGLTRIISIWPHTIRVHRLSAYLHYKLNLSNRYELALHKQNCPNKSCWNPEHLYVGTQSDNIMDQFQTGARNKPESHQTHCNRGHEMNDLNKRKTIVKGGYTGYKCKACETISQRIRRQKQKQIAT